jgi:hypothetical protein
VSSARYLEDFGRYGLGSVGEIQTFLGMKGTEECRRHAPQSLAERILGLRGARDELGARHADPGRPPSADVQILENADFDFFGTVRRRAATAGRRFQLRVFPEEKRRSRETRTRLFDAGPGGQDGKCSLASARERSFERQGFLCIAGRWTDERDSHRENQSWR